MHKQSFFHKSWIMIENRPLGRGDFQEIVGYRLRGIWRYAQDTAPIRACFLNNPRGLRTLGTVDGLSTVSGIQKKYNKISVRVTS